MSSTVVALNPAFAKQVRAALRICALLTEGSSRRRCLARAAGFCVSAIRAIYSMSPGQFTVMHLGSAGEETPARRRRSKRAGLRSPANLIMRERSLIMEAVSEGYLLVFGHRLCSGLGHLGDRDRLGARCAGLADAALPRAGRVLSGARDL